MSYVPGAIAHSLIVLGAIGLLARVGGRLYAIAAALILALVRALSASGSCSPGLRKPP